MDDFKYWRKEEIAEHDTCRYRDFRNPPSGEHSSIEQYPFVLEYETSYEMSKTRTAGVHEPSSLPLIVVIAVVIVNFDVICKRSNFKIDKYRCSKIMWVRRTNRTSY